MENERDMDMKTGRDEDRLSILEKIERGELSIEDAETELAHILEEPEPMVEVTEEKKEEEVRTMSGELVDFNPVSRITIGTVGPPGQRTFLLQASQGTTDVTLKLEKEQAKTLASSILELLDDKRRF